jgi:hypothetical protein
MEFQHKKHLESFFHNEGCKLQLPDVHLWVHFQASISSGLKKHVTGCFTCLTCVLNLQLRGLHELWQLAAKPGQLRCDLLKGP